MCGLVGNPDLAVLRAFLQSRAARTSPREVLEIGAGYGRVAESLLRESPETRITLLEVSPTSAAFLRDRFQRETRVTLVEKSILEIQLPRRFDLALWMWAGFLDFTPTEKAEALRRIAEWLLPGSLLAIEVPRSVGREVKRDLSGSLVLDFLGTRWYGNVMEAEAIRKIARSAGFLPVRELQYETETGLKRTLHLLERGSVR